MGRQVSPSLRPCTHVLTVLVSPQRSGDTDVDFELTEEQRMVQASVREFVAGEIAPRAHEYDETARFPREQLKGLAELGLLGMIIPEEWGGAGFDAVAYAVALEEIARADASVCVIVGVTNSVCCYPILSFGTDEQKEKYL